MRYFSKRSRVQEHSKPDPLQNALTLYLKSWWKNPRLSITIFAASWWSFILGSAVALGIRMDFFSWLIIALSTFLIARMGLILGAGLIHFAAEKRGIYGRRISIFYNALETSTLPFLILLPAGIFARATHRSIYFFALLAAILFSIFLMRAALKEIYSLARSGDWQVWAFPFLSLPTVFMAVLFMILILAQSL